jgi:hypothetical protein
MRSPPSSAAEKEVTAVFRARPDSMPNIERLYADNSMPETNSDVKSFLRAPYKFYNQKGGRRGGKPSPHP